MTDESGFGMGATSTLTTIVSAGLSATLPDGFQWGADAMELFEVGKAQAVAAILAALGWKREEVDALGTPGMFK